MAGVEVGEWAVWSLVLISIEFFVAANSEKSLKNFEKSLKYSKMVH